MNKPSLLIIQKPNKAFAANIRIAGSKSESNRALILQAISKNSISIVGLSTADDCMAMQAALNSNAQKIDCGHAGTTFRFLTAYFSSIPGKEVLLTGSESLTRRPIAPLVDALRKLGASISYMEQEGFPPLSISGKALVSLEPIAIDASISSQFISALMLISTNIKNGLTLVLSANIVSSPYILMTKKMLAKAGIQTEMNSNQLNIPSQEFSESTIEIEADWSSASYWYAIVSLGYSEKVKLLGLKKDSIQGDQQIASIMESFGISTTFLADGIEIKKTSTKLATQEINCLAFPDLAPTLIVLSAALKLCNSFTGLSTLKIKETDRILALQTELKKIAVNLTEQNEVYSLSYDKAFNFEEMPTFASYEDHRMALSLATLSMQWKKVGIHNPMVITKSYPNFWNDLTNIGFELKFK